MSVEICRDLSCAIYEATGSIVAELVTQVVDQPFIEKKSEDDIRLCVVEEEMRHTGEKFYVCSFETGNKDDCP